MALPPRPSVTADVLAVLRDDYGLRWTGDTVDLGGSSNLNLLVDGTVVRVHRSWVSEARLDAQHRLRRVLREHGVPFPETITTCDGRGWSRAGPCLVEAERYAPGTNMDDCGGTLLRGLPVLARIHDVLRDVDAGAAAHAPSPNHIAAEDVLRTTLRAVAVMRAWSTPLDAWIADVAEELALALHEARAGLAPPSQLVHGDFWDNNVLFDDGSEIVAVLDLDMMGVRPRVDDLALTLYYVSSTHGGGDHSDERIALLREHVDAYDAALQDALTSEERAALPLAIARGVLAFAPHLLERDDEDAQRSVALGYSVDLRWSLELVKDFRRWQDGFARR